MTGSYLIETAVIKIFRLLVLARISLGVITLSILAFLLDEPVPLVRLIGLLIFIVLALYLYIPILETCRAIAYGFLRTNNVE